MLVKFIAVRPVLCLYNKSFVYGFCQICYILSFFPADGKGESVQRTDRHGKQTGPVSYFFAAVYD